jgi:hypothetical protein
MRRRADSEIHMVTPSAHPTSVASLTTKYGLIVRHWHFTGKRLNQRLTDKAFAQVALRS